MHMHDSEISICSESAFREYLRQTLTDPDKILQVYLGRTQISGVKTLTSWAKGVQNGGEKMGVYCNGYSEVVFFVTGQVGMKCVGKRQLVCSIEP